MLQIPACATVVDASPLPWEVVSPDPNYQFDGIKWETGAGFESGEFNVVLSGELTIGIVQVGVKGPDVAIGEIAGPACAVTTTSPTATVISGTITPTLTASVEVTASPIDLAPAETAVPATIQPPPASSGLILITDNDQNLTFTCNGNSVEVRGNAKCIAR